MKIYILVLVFLLSLLVGGYTAHGATPLSARGQQVLAERGLEMQSVIKLSEQDMANMGFKYNPYTGKKIKIKSDGKVSTIENQLRALEARVLKLETKAR